MTHENTALDHRPIQTRITEVIWSETGGNDIECSSKIADAVLDALRADLSPAVTVKSSLMHVIRFCIEFTDKAAGEGVSLEGLDPYDTLTDFWDTQGWDVNGPEWIDEVMSALTPTTGEREATAHECEAEIVGVNPFTVAPSAEKTWMTKTDLGAVRVAIYDALQESLFVNEHGDIEGVSTASHAAIAALIDTPTPPAAPSADVSIRTMKLSGDREEHWVRIKCGDRTFDVRNYPGEYYNRALYEYDTLRHVLFNMPKPSLRDEQYADPATPPAAPEPESVDPTVLEMMRVAASLGRVEWGTTPEHNADGHAAHVKKSVQITAEIFDQSESQQMHGVYIEGSETVIAHTGTSPNSPTHARILTGLWNKFVADAERAIAEQGEA